MKKIFVILVLISILILSNCGGGIEPEPEIPKEERAGFSGTIYFKGEWNPAVKRTHLVVFKDPLNSAADFNIFNLKFVSLEIPYETQEYSYNSTDSAYVPISAGEYSYVAVAQSLAEELSLDRKDWFVAGVYYAEGDTINPDRLVIPEKTLIKGIDIICDFDNPPPQPPGGF
jgi:hypothetical protein